MQNFKKVFLVLVFLSFLLLLACEPKIKEGRIIKKKHHQQFQTVVFIPIVNSSGSITTTTLIPIFQFYPESWEIVIEGYDYDSNKDVKQSFYVQKDVYDSVNEGEYFEYNKQMNTKRPVEEREATKEEQKQFAK